MISVSSSILIIAVTAGVTFLTRVFPFIVFGRKKTIPTWVTYLGKVLPPAIIATLVIYCLKDVNVFVGNRGIPELISVCGVFILHIWKKNTLLSIGVGTLLYMILIQFVFC